MTSAAPFPLASISDQPDQLTPAQVLATVAHELRQPLSNIESIAYYLSMVLPDGDARAQSELARIRRLVEQSSSILTNGLRRAGYELPIALDAAAPEPVDQFDSRQLCLMLDMNAPADPA